MQSSAGPPPAEDFLLVCLRRVKKGGWRRCTPISPAPSIPMAVYPSAATVDTARRLGDGLLLCCDQPVGPANPVSRLLRPAIAPGGSAAAVSPSSRISLLGSASSCNIPPGTPPAALTFIRWAWNRRMHNANPAVPSISCRPRQGQDRRREPELRSCA
jgi:hypothetical protein